MKTLLLLGGLCLLIIAILASRDRRYAQKSLKETAPEDLKAYLNLKNANSTFDQKLDPSDKHHPTASHQILKELNSKSED